MKIRNKKTGQVLDVNDNRAYIHCGDIAIAFNSLKWVFDNWEDYDENTGYWYIDFDGDVLSWASEVDEETDRKREAIGNYFNTREEAEKAVEKLKAWKRLKDKGLRFTGIAGVSNIIFVSFESDDKYNAGHIMYDEYNSTDNKLKEYNEDLMLLFGGEE